MILKNVVLVVQFESCPILITFRYLIVDLYLQKTMVLHIVMTSDASIQSASVREAPSEVQWKGPIEMGSATEKETGKI